MNSQITVRRQFVGTTTTGGVVSFTPVESNETFVSFAEKRLYNVYLTRLVMELCVQGDIVSVSGKTSGTGTATVTVTDNTILGGGAKVKFIRYNIKNKCPI